MRSPLTVTENIRPILGAIQTVPRKPPWEGDVPREERRPFITISRQPGAGAWTLARDLVDALNASGASASKQQPWTCWDRELVEKVAADHHLSERLIDSLQESDHSWIGDLLSGLSSSTFVDEMSVYKRVANTMLALARVGHLVIVGRGSVFVTHQVAGGIHVRLVAPLEKRISIVEESMHMDHRKAAAWVADMERKRAQFYKRFWPYQALEPERFTITLNTAMLSPAQMVRVLRDLVEEPATKTVIRR